MFHSNPVAFVALADSFYFGNLPPTTQQDPKMIYTLLTPSLTAVLLYHWGFF